MADFAEKMTPLAGWGRYRPAMCRVLRPVSQPELAGLLADGGTGRRIARGLGRSYGDTSVNADGAVVDMTRLNRMTAFDEETGVLDCEAGVSLSEILEVFVPRGWMPAVLPGTRFVTVGGAIANDVHGKNHHLDGSFGDHVASLSLWTPALGVVECSPEQDPELFWATVGGVGLTGVILSARLRLRRIASAWVSVDYVRCANLQEALDAFSESDKDYQYSVAWVDCLSGEESLGRSVLMRGNPAPAAMLPPARSLKPFDIPRRPTLSVPVDFPQFLLNPYSIRAFNDVFYSLHKTSKGHLVDYEKYFFPLDRILHWNRMYGRRGFVQYQATFPLERADGLRRLLELCSRAKRASFLAVLKRFGGEGRGLLSHPMPGHTITLDIPNAPGLEDFLRELDAVLLDAGGRLYLAKDAAATPGAIAAMYPRLDAFRAVCRRADPDGLMSSNLSRRLALTGNGEAAHD